MIHKFTLQNIISKYYLNGLIEAVKWEIKDNELIIRFMSPTKDMLGTVKYNDFKVVDTELAIFNTTQLIKLIGITSGDLGIDIVKQNKTALRLNIADSQFNLTYALADTLLINKVAKVEEPSQYSAELKLTSEHIVALIKAKSALAETDHVSITTTTDLNGDKGLEFTIGDEGNFSNKITYFIPAEVIKDFNIPFGANVFKEILSANKDNTGTLKISSEGLMKIDFENEDKSLISNYFLVRKQEQ
jgi:hypothetical protein